MTGQVTDVTADAMSGTANLRVVFMGTPDFAVPTLSALVEAGCVVPLVVTRPDAVRGRGKALVPSPVKTRALELGLPVLEARRLGEDEVAAVLEAQPDVIVVAAYGAIIPDALLGDAVARLGVVNVHASLLPRWRGAAPIQRAVLAGDERIGVSIMRIVHELDAGAYCRQAWVEGAGSGAAALMSELGELGARELVAALGEMDAGTVKWIEQDPSLVTYASKIDKVEMVLDPVDPAEMNVRRVLASTDAAPARTVVGGRGVRVCAARVVSVQEACTLTSGEIAPGGVAVHKGRVLLGCADAVLEPLVVKPDGKREMPASAWAAGLRGELAWGPAE